MTINEFTSRLKNDGSYIGEDNHIHRSDGRLLSRLCRNGYYLTRKMYDGKCHHFMEHRVIWCWVNGDIDPDKVINHKDFDRANNAIDNLELITQQENMDWSVSHNHTNALKGADSPKALMSEGEVKLIRYLCKNGYSQKEVAKIFDVKHANLISRIVTGARYGNIQDASSIVSIYPLLVEKTSRSDLDKNDRIANAALGMAGEVGEVVDACKKYFFQGHELDVNHILDEMGDVLYYCCWMAIEMDIDFSEICFNNMRKLSARYPDGFDAERSRHRQEGDI